MTNIRPDPGFEPGTPRLQAPGDMNEPSRSAVQYTIEHDTLNGVLLLGHRSRLWEGAYRAINTIIFMHTLMGV